MIVSASTGSPSWPLDRRCQARTTSNDEVSNALSSKPLLLHVRIVHRLVNFHLQTEDTPQLDEFPPTQADVVTPTPPESKSFNRSRRRKNPPGDVSNVVIARSRCFETGLAALLVHRRHFPTPLRASTSGLRHRGIRFRHVLLLVVVIGPT